MNSRQAPNVGAILWAHMPEQETCSHNVKVRPVLVLDLQEESGVTYLVVAKGTSQRCHEIYNGEFVVRSSHRDAQLQKDTKFCLGRIERIPFNDHWFEISNHYGFVPSACIADFRRAAIEAHLIR